MGRILLSCAFLFVLFGCSSNSPTPPATNEPGAVLNEPGGTAGKEQISEGPAESELPKILDVPLYPGAKVTSNVVATVGEEKRYRVKLETPDPVKKVAEFYTKSKLAMEVRDDKAQYMGPTEKGNNVLMFAESKDGKTEITIRVSPAAH